MFNVCLCARYQSNPKESHLKAVKWIIRYLNGTQNIGLWYDRESTLILNTYTNSDFADYKIDRKSTSGVCQFLGCNLILWSSKKQNSTILSTAKAEYVTFGSCCAQLLWTKRQLEDFSITSSKILIKCDNTSVINLSKNPVQHSKSKHIEISHHFIRKYVANEDVMLEYINTKNQIVDIFTKPLSED